MIRLLAGSLRGRALKVPHTGTRPTSARVREAVFDILRHAGLFGPGRSCPRVADLYAGSGAMGFEALSLGASEVVFVEASRRAVRTLRDNVRRLEMGHRVSVVLGRLPEAAARLPGPFDCVFLDPPYARWRDGLDTLRILLERGQLTPRALCLLEVPRAVFPDLDARPFEVERIRSWGDTGVVFLQPPREEEYRESEGA